MTNIPVPDENSPAITAKGDMRRAAMLKAAATVFEQHGYKGASLGDIISRSGGSKRSLYDYFDSKEGLFRAVIAEHCQSILNMFSDMPLLDSNNVETTLRNIGLQFAAALMDPSRIRLFRVIISEAERFPMLGQLYFETGPKAAMGILAPYMQKQLSLSREASEVAAMQFLDMVKAPIHLEVLLHYREAADEDVLNRHVQQAVVTFLHGAAALS